MSTTSVVVYVEDHRENFALVKKALEATGRYEVLQAESGEEALTMISERRPALVLLDLDLPGMDGISMALAMKADPRLHSIPIIVITASVMDDERQAAVDAGCMAFIEKPFDIARLRAWVAHAIEGGKPPENVE
jgi:two-component system cell cycle response regulator DivK